jgi:hypothetical protein
MIFYDYKTLLTPNNAKLYNNLYNDFDLYYFTAIMLEKKGLYVKCCCALSKAFAFIKQILRAEHSQTLACFLKVFIHLIQTRLPKVTFCLCDFIKKMFVQVTSTKHP